MKEKWLLMLVVCFGMFVGCTKPVSETVTGGSVGKQHYVEFDASGTKYHWSDDDTIGFWWYSCSSCYVDIFKTSDSYFNSDPDWSDPNLIVFKKYLFIKVKDKQVKTYTYTSADGSTDISYYDKYGNAYYSFYSGCYVTIIIIKWTKDSILGSFSAKLYSSNNSSYRILSGTFVSFDSDDIMNPSINIMSVPNNIYNIHKELYDKAKKN